VSYTEATKIRQSPRAFDVGEYDLTDEEFAVLRGLYQAELSYVDSNLADLLATLNGAGIRENTVIAVCGDHGENIGDHGFFGHQYSLYDTVLHVPLVVVGGPFNRNRRHRELVQILDLPITLLDAAGIDAPAFRNQQQGHSLLFDESRTSTEMVFAEYFAPQPPLSVLESRFDKVPEHVRARYRTLRSVRTRRWKYIRGNDGTSELYRIDRDPDETTNLSDEATNIVERLDDRLDKWLTSFDHEDVTGDVDISDSTKARLVELGYR
jgi:arylsulfatase A-like enzyme